MAGRSAQVSALLRRQTRIDARIKWFGDEVKRGVAWGLSQRVRIAGQLLRDKVVANISIPVIKGVGPSGRTVVTQRSRQGEFPRADTTRLMKDIFFQVEPSGVTAVVGTTLDYGLILETSLARSFLRRTLNENRNSLIRILAAPERPGEFKNR